MNKCQTSCHNPIFKALILENSYNSRPNGLADCNISSPYGLPDCNNLSPYLRPDCNNSSPFGLPDCNNSTPYGLHDCNNSGPYGRPDCNNHDSSSETAVAAVVSAWQSSNSITAGMWPSPLAKPPGSVPKTCSMSSVYSWLNASQLWTTATARLLMLSQWLHQCCSARCSSAQCKCRLQRLERHCTCAEMFLRIETNLPRIAAVNP